jgi:hypothetical protein
MHLLLSSSDSHRVQKIIISKYLILIMALFYQNKVGIKQTQTLRKTARFVIARFVIKPKSDGVKVINKIKEGQNGGLPKLVCNFRGKMYPLQKLFYVYHRDTHMSYALVYRIILQ